MATVGAAICMCRVADRYWTKAIYAAAMVTACCNLENSGAGECRAHQHHDILPQTHTERPCQYFINLNKIHEITMKTAC